MSLLVVNDKKLLITGFYILNSKQIYPNKSDDTKFGLFSENSLNLLLEFLKIYINWYTYYRCLFGLILGSIFGKVSFHGGFFERLILILTNQTAIPFGNVHLS